MSTSPDTEKQLREVLSTLAGQVHAAPNAYGTTRGGWVRRERRRRLILAVLITVVFTLAVLIGLWVLNRAPSGHSAIFNNALGHIASLAAPETLEPRT